MPLEAFESPNSPEMRQGDTSTFIRRFKVDAGNKNIGPIDVLGATNLPQRHALYAFNAESHSLARVVERIPRRITPGSDIWEVEILYEAKEEETFDNPLAELPIVDVDGETIQELVKGSIDNMDAWEDGIRNSAGELINPPPMRDVNRPILTITRNEDITTDVGLIIRTYANAVNSDTFWGSAAGSALMKAPKVSRQVKEVDDEGLEFVYLTITYRIVFSVDEFGWDLAQLDHGNYYINNASQKIYFKTDDGHPFIGLLDGMGDQSNTPVYLDPIRLYKRATFGDLSLPDSFTDF